MKKVENKTGENLGSVWIGIDINLNTKMEDEDNVVLMGIDNDQTSLEEQ